MRRRHAVTPVVADTSTVMVGKRPTGAVDSEDRTGLLPQTPRAAMPRGLGRGDKQRTQRAPRSCSQAAAKAAAARPQGARKETGD